jgi:deoxyhypusine synthase
MEVPLDRQADAIAKSLNLKPMKALDVAAAESTSDLLRGMAGTAFTGRMLGEAADVMEAMLRDPKCTVVMTLTGAMTMAGLRRLITEMVERGWVQCLIATGALVGHGLVEALGMTHYKADPNTSDDEYFTLRMNRVYDTIEPEQNLDELEVQVREVFRTMAEERGGEPVGTAEILQTLGRALPGEGILQSAAARGVDVLIPAFTDSELGLDLAVHHERARRTGSPALGYDAFRDLERYRALCEQAVADDGKLGIFTIGGGVPRNWAQQIGPYIDVLNTRLGTNVPRIRFDYGVRICPDPVHYGHLSGCTYSEGVTWGKFTPIAEGGRYAEVLLDATVGWPLLVRAMIDRGL